MLKNYKELLKEEIERKGMAGLYCSEVPCGCLKDDLMPCGCIDEEAVEGCEMGKRMDYKADDQCGCEGQGIDHWHICDPNFHLPTGATNG